jgi:hypothetical protein
MSPQAGTANAPGALYAQGRTPTGTYQQAQTTSAGGYVSMSGSNTLPPISALHTRHPPDSSTRFTHFSHETASPRQKRAGHRYPDSNVTSAHTSSDEEDGMGASGLVAPLEVLRGLADAAVAHKVRPIIVPDVSHL